VNIINAKRNAPVFSIARIRRTKGGGPVQEGMIRALEGQKQ
jgi:hypothetical protein